MKTVFALVLVAFAMSASAASLRLGAVRGFPGNTVEVPVSLRYGSNDLRDVVAMHGTGQSRRSAYFWNETVPTIDIG